MGATHWLLLCFKRGMERKRNCVTDYYRGSICITAHARVLINSWIPTNQLSELRPKPMTMLQSNTGMEIQDGWLHSTTVHAKV